MDLKEIQIKQQKFIEERKWQRFSSTEVFVHLIEELGEVGSHLLYASKYKVKGAGHAGNEDQVSQELAQAFNLFLQICIHLDVDLEDAWEQEYQRNLERFDPVIWQKLAKDDD
jgi:NTP pyrophosphatase (non-canonical NTP hydrolase)